MKFNTKLKKESYMNHLVKTLHPSAHYNTFSVLPDCSMNSI